MKPKSPSLIHSLLDPARFMRYGTGPGGASGAMAIPTGLVATPAIGDVQLVWDTVSDATWRVYRNTADNFQGATLVATVTAASHAQAGTSGTPYYFWITRYNSTTGDETLPTLSVTATPS